MKKTDNEIYLRLFVYGTLKRGFWNHDRFCSQASIGLSGNSMIFCVLASAIGSAVP
jgi:gamma-glutamylcyclotransferase (GGCT)/AIG2-like uncharacterized protein YtfP